MPKLWDETIEAHRRSVRDATLDAAGALIAKRGLRSVTMSEVAERTGIGRATLYKYFADVDSILAAWHERQIRAHLEELAAIRAGPGDACARLASVLEAYALIQYEHPTGELAALLHRGEHVARARQHLSQFIAELVREAVADGEVRDDIAPAELATYFLHALTASGELTSKAAVERLVALTLAAAQPPASNGTSRSG